MILNKYKSTILFLIVLFFLCGFNVSAQNKTILIFDPYQVSTNFQNSFHQLSSDSIYVADTLDVNINNFAALFLFIGYPYVLSEEEGNKLIEYLNLNKPIYMFVQNIKQVTYWNYVGVTGFAFLPLFTTVDRVVGVNTTFTENIVIDTSFVSGSIPGLQGNISPLLTGISDSSISLTTTYIPVDKSTGVIIDFFNLIHHSEFLERVLLNFGLEEITGIDDNADQPNIFYLYQNYPNPFNPSTEINYSLKKDGIVVIKVFDVLGKEVAFLKNKYEKAGNYSVNFNAANLPSGIYFYRITAGSFHQTKKMMLLK